MKQSAPNNPAAKSAAPFEHRMQVPGIVLVNPWGCYQGTTLAAWTLRGNLSKIDTVGILSASNEAGRALSVSENNRRDEALSRDLAGYARHQVRGRFGDVGKPFLSMDNPFIVVNMARKNVVALGAKYHQFHVIFGTREGEGQDLAWRFELVEADRAARVLAARKIFFDAHRQRLYLGASYPGSRGRHFVIPAVYDNNLDLTFLKGR